MTLCSAMHCNAKVIQCVRKYIPLCTAGGFMHNGWKKICRSICRKMDVFVQRRRLCNLITSVASVADSALIICSYSVLITQINFVVLWAVGDGDLGRGGEILAQLLTRGLPLAGCLLHQCAPGGVSLGQGVHEGEGCLVANSATPVERAPEKPLQGCTMVPLSRSGCVLLGKVTRQPGTSVHGNSGAEEEQN